MFNKIIAIVAIVFGGIMAVEASQISEKDFSAAVNTAVTEIIKHEGFRSSWYTCPGGKKTIGHGLTEHFWHETTITKEQSKAVVKQRCEALGKEILLLLKKKVNTNQLAALISFTYNVGIGNFKNSTLLKELNKGNFSKVPSEMQRWVYAKGKKLTGLINRRAAESALWQLV